MNIYLHRAILIACVGATAACGASSSTSGPTGPAPTGIVVSLAPLASQVGPGGTIAFTASVTGAVDTGITWSVQEGVVGGTINASGLYTAPAGGGTFHVVATSKADASRVQIATVTVTASGTAVVALSPSSSSADACQTVAFSATVSGAGNQGITWSVREGPSGGTITSAGLYTAPSAAGTYHVVAASQADPTRTSEGTVTVAAERVLAVAVTPGTGSVVPGGALAFSAMVTTTCGTFAAQ